MNHKATRFVQLELLVSKSHDKSTKNSLSTGIDTHSGTFLLKAVLRYKMQQILILSLFCHIYSFTLLMKVLHCREQKPARIFVDSPLGKGKSYDLMNCPKNHRVNT